MSERVIVQKILSKRIHPLSNEIQYLLKWKDKPQDRSTWEPISKLNNIKNMIKLYQGKSEEGGRKKRTKKSQEDKKFQEELKQIRQLFKVKKDPKPMKLPYIKQVPEQSDSHQQIKLFLLSDSQENKHKQEEKNNKNGNQVIQKTQKPHFYRSGTSSYQNKGQWHSQWNSKWQRKWMSQYHYQDDTAQLYQVLHYPKVDKDKSKKKNRNGSKNLQEKESFGQQGSQKQIDKTFANKKTINKLKPIKKQTKIQTKKQYLRVPLSQFQNQNFIPVVNNQQKQSSQPTKSLNHFQQSQPKQSPQQNNQEQKEQSFIIESQNSSESESQSQKKLRRRRTVGRSISILRMQQNQDDEVCYLVKLDGKIKWQNRQTLFQNHLEQLCDYYQRRLFQQIRKNREYTYQEHKNNQL